MTKNLDALIQSITDEADQAIAKFNSNTDQIQKSVYDRILRVVKDLKLTGGKLAKTGENVRAISKLKADILSAIQTDQYVAQVADFAKAFNTVTKLQNQYFSALVKDFKPAAVLKDIRNDAVDLAVESLTDTGLEENLVKPVQDLIRTSVNSGGSYADLSDQIKNYILGESKVDGALVKYAGQITTDSINNYSATYHDLVSEDLGLEWFMFTGSMLTTSRPMCVAMNDIKFFHVSQIPELLKGIVNGVQTPVNKKTGLPNGFRANTTVSNYMQVRNGYRCGHQFVRVTESVVPPSIVYNFKKAKSNPNLPTRSRTENADRSKKAVQDKLGLPINEVRVSPEMNPLQFTRMTDQIEKLFSQYKPSKAWKPTSRVNLVFRSDSSALGWVATSLDGAYMTTINFGHRIDSYVYKKGTQRMFSRVDEDKRDIAVVNHEFAHVLTVEEHATLPGIDSKLKEFWLKMYDLRMQYTKEMLKFALRRDINGLNDIYLGDYADFNISEFMAEGFKEYTSYSKPTKYAVKIGKLIDEYFKS